MNQTIKTFLIVVILVLITLILMIGLGNALGPLCIAFVMAYLSFPLIHWLEKRGIRRLYAVIGVFALVALLISAILVLVVPSLIEDAKLFFHELPLRSAALIEKIEALSLKFGYELDLSRQGIKDLVAEHANTISGDFLKSSSFFLKKMFSNFISGILVILNLLLIPLFLFHLINGYEVISQKVKELIPFPWRPKAEQYVTLINTVLNGYIRGQILVSLILATLYSLGFSLIGLRFGFLIGIGTGLMSIVPFVGSITGFIAAMIVALTNYTGPTTVVGVLIVFVIVQVLEGFLITPKLVGNKVGLGILTTILALIIGGNLFGFAGMIIAIPAAAILKSIIRDLETEYKELKFYRG